MATKKSKIKFDASPALPSPRPADPPRICKTKCGRRASIEYSWCSACYAKYKKGHYVSSGDISPDFLKRQREIEDKRKRRAARRATKKLEDIRDTLSKKITLPLLRVLTSTNPDLDKAKYCEKLAFWTSDQVCYSRLFIMQHKKCSKCKVHDSSLESLLCLVEESNVQDTTSAATEAVPQNTEFAGNYTPAGK